MITSLGLSESCLVLSVVLVPLVYYYWRKPRYPYPPGPKPLPIVQNAFDIPTIHATQVFAEWSKKYDSDVIYLSALGNHIVILNSVEAANDLCKERSSKYSSRYDSIRHWIELCQILNRRPHFTMSGELLNAERFLVVMPYGESWLARRRMFQHYFPSSNPGRVTVSRVEEYIRQHLLLNILNSPKDFLNHVHHATGGATLSLAYGLHIQRFNDPWIKLARLAVEVTTEAVVVGRYFVDIFPVLKYVPEWVPGAGFQKIAKEGRKVIDRFFNETFNAAIVEIAQGVAQPSFVSLALEEGAEKETPGLKDVIRDVAAVFFAAGSDTTATAIINFILLMVIRPDIQARVQKELDRVVGSDRLPSYHDKTSMPYLSAVLKEVLRWRPVVPGGMPHCSTVDDVYRGYYIPKGTIIINNAWAMLHDERLFPDPDRFDPNRFLTATGELKTDGLDPEVVATFGFGRRQCPGAQLALTTIFVAAASLLASFDIRKPLNTEGEEVDPVVHYAGYSAFDIPTPFECRFIPRSKRAEALIHSETLNSDDSL